MSCQDPVYGYDVRRKVTIMPEMPQNNGCWNGQGYMHCYCIQTCKRPYHPHVYWRRTEALAAVLYTPETCREKLKEVIER